MPCNKEWRSLPQTGLKRLPGDFSWQLLQVLFNTLSSGLDEAGNDIRSVLRKRSATEYHNLRKLTGLQSINRTPGRLPYKMAISRLLTEMCSKTAEFETVSAKDRKAAAIAKSISLDTFPSFVPDPVLEEARLQIARLLPPVEIEDIYRHSRHGPGKTVLPYVRTSAYFKFAAYPYTVTPNARALLCDFIRTDDRWYGALEASYRRARGIEPWKILPRAELFGETLKGVPYNRIVTVPKDGTKDRTIAIEPMGNVMLQLGVDGVFRRALRAWNIDLDDQTRNQRLAELGSLNWQLRNASVFPASLDLSSASDRVSRTLCEFLLPRPWFDLLDRLRAPYGSLPDGTMWKYHRMSSMGNGSTFALESLIFAAIIRAIVRRCGHPSDMRMVAVYGDDCLYPAYLDPVVRRYFEYVGFIINEEKTFSQGPVRESCGSDFYSGFNIRPVYVPERITCVESLLGLRNGLFLWFRRVLGMNPPPHLMGWLDSYLDCDVGTGPALQQHRSEYRFEDLKTLVPIHVTRTVGRKAPEIRAREIEFRKLMHPLLSCTSDGGSRFGVYDRSIGTLVVARRTVFCYQAEDYLQASAVPEWDESLISSTV